MGLEEYKKKRDFTHTPEPVSEKEGKESNRELIFVVQWHNASHLHFDFRLQWEDVLLSWAVPKGPSMNPKDKRLAVMVEDHPLDYAGFQGEIPEGNYGAGTVKIWDNGTWEPDEKSKDVKEALKKGALEFTLYGEKLKGKFKLIELKNTYTKNGWLLIKRQDEEAQDSSYSAFDVS